MEKEIDFDEYMANLRAKHSIDYQVKEETKKIMQQAKPKNPYQEIQYAYAENIKKSELLREDILKGTLRNVPERELLLLAAECISTMINDKDFFYHTVKERICK